MVSRNCSVLAVLAASLVSGASLTPVYQNNDFQFTGLSVSKANRLFVNYPRWSDRYLYAVVEVSPDGSAKPYPNLEWNQWNSKPDTVANHFICVQSIVVDDTDALWIVDAAAPMLGPDVPNGPKLVKVDLKTNAVSRVYPMGPDIAKADSYLNDIRVDTHRGFAYLTDSGHGGLIVVNTSTGQAHRALDGLPAVLVQPGVQVVVNGKTLLHDGKPPQFNADGLALSRNGDYVYFKPVTGTKLYRIKTALLRDLNATPNQLSAAVEMYADTYPTDGLWTDEKDNLYLSDVQHNAVTRITPSHKMETVVSDPRLQWPDTFTEGPDGYIYISASHINESPTFNMGKSVRKTPFGIFKFKP